MPTSALARFSAIIAFSFITLLYGGARAATTAQTEPPPGPQGGTSCTQHASPACLHALELPNDAGRMRYYASLAPAVSGSGPETTDAPAPRAALVIMHGHSRDANLSFDAALLAATRADRLQGLLVVAPLFQVADQDATHCRTPGNPTAEPGDALWTCGSWADGRPSRKERSERGEHGIGSYAALDALLAEMLSRWPSLREITLVGFSAGAQILQRSIGFAADPPAGVRLRYVIADPGSWLYFDPVRPQLMRGGQPVDWADCGSSGDASNTTWGNCDLTFRAPEASACEDADRWKYGTQALPRDLTRSASDAKTRYIAADITYLEGALDFGEGKGRAYRVLDRSCGAMLQGPFRLQRGLAYAAYDRQMLAPARNRRLTVVPGCAHDVACVIPSNEARAALFGPP